MKLRITRHTAAYWRVTIDNPPLNMLDPEMIEELHALINDLETSRTIAVVVFDSADPEYFMAHYDLLRANETSMELGATGLRRFPDFTTRLSRLPAISIASIRGRARGVGSEFALACDMRFGSRETLVLAQIEVGLGVLPGGGGSERLPLAVGRSRALEIIAGSADYDADTAERYGWINRAIADSELDDFVDTYARRVASFSRDAIAAAKRVVNRASRLPEDAHLIASEDAFTRALDWPDTRARIAWSLKEGFQQRGEFERNMGEALGPRAMAGVP
jgi:enoyl-CoA hydratase/carnithine racemase